MLEGDRPLGAAGSAPRLSSTNSTTLLDAVQPEAPWCTTIGDDSRPWQLQRIVPRAAMAREHLDHRLQDVNAPSRLPQSRT